jgi:hypothetical protein
MDLAHWLTAFKVLHEKARRGALGMPEAREYRARRAELTRALLTAQDLTRQPGQSPRRSLRVARALQVELEGAGRKDRITTFDVSTGGFSAPMASAPRPGDVIAATLHLPGVEPLATSVKVVGTRAQAGSLRVSFAFGEMEGAAAERLEFAIFDMVLAQLGQPPPRPA